MVEKHPYVLGPTVLTGTSQVDIGGTGKTFKVPLSGTLTGIKIESHRAGIPTVAESDAVVVRLFSKSAPIIPYEALAQPVNAGISTDIIGYKEESFIYPVNCPVVAGDEIQVTGAELTACSVHPYVTVTLYMAFGVIMTPHYYSVVGTHTATGTAAAEVPMTNDISISGISKIMQIYAETVDVTVASGKGIVSKFRISSSQIQIGGDIEFAGEGVPGALAGATGSTFGRLTKEREIEIGVNSPAIFKVYHSLGVTITATGYFNIQIVYIK